ncbi:putative lipoprotein [Treponema primitia ZAS-2]|uniref:Putative lipoprotein n=1 Tax=Treponema primitia (strain ATCC BAA-887 / DSM 12427 / ZAS-2) TaxID=545694 RepID=F5YJB3_TREPZ|nr:peptidyl-prolyl cis-trans isomerase [Treponema primitia]AEF85030.1 putative lipoprotein [Treponema primitia ZAS-2]
MDMKICRKIVFFLALIGGIGITLQSCKGNSEPVQTPLPEGTPLSAGGDAQNASGLTPDQLDLQTVARINLTRNEYVFVKQLRLEVERRSKLQEVPPGVSNLELRRMVLDAMISERLVLQAAEREGISSPNSELEQRIQMIRASAGRPVTDQEFAEGIEKQYGLNLSSFQTYLHEDLIRQKYIEQYIVQEAEKAKSGNSITDREIEEQIQQFKDEMASQAGRVPTDEEFNDFIKRQGMDITALRGQIRRQLTVQNYLIGIAGGEPTEEQIQTMYNRNKARFVRPDTISFDYIRVPFGTGAEARTRSRARADELAKKIGSSSAVFNEESAIAETSNNSGSARYIQLSTEDPRVQQVFGLNFIDKALPLEENAVSGVIEGQQGFFIIKVTRKYRQANLGLEDIYRWGNAATVRDMIKSQMLQQTLTEGAAVVTNTLAENLRKEGAVEIHEQFLLW